MNRSRLYYLFGATIFTSIATLLVLLVVQERVRVEIGQVFMAITGMLSMAALASLERFMRTATTSRYLSKVTLDNSPISELISSESKLFDPQRLAEAKHALADIPPWELNPTDLVGKDNSLALAKLRMDIERELRRIAQVARLDTGDNRRTINSLAQDLVDKGALPAEWLFTLKDIVAVCNEAVHGREVATDAALNVIRIGNELLKGLYILRNEIENNPRLPIETLTLRTSFHDSNF